MIEIKVNNKNYQFPEHSSLQIVIDQLKINQQGIAIAVNQQVIAKQLWETTQLKKHDDILIIHATQGG